MKTASVLDGSERHALAFHALYAVVAAGVLAAPVATLGERVLALVLGYNLGLAIASQLLGHREWLELWLFLVPLSAFQLLPDQVLSAGLGVLEFPDIGGPRIGAVNASMAGMWTIALWPIVFLGRRVEARKGRRAALAAVAVASLAGFVGSEALAWRIPIWFARDVVMVGHVALYVVVPEILLGLATFRVFETTARRPLAVRVSGALALSLSYLGALLIFYFLIEDVFRGC